MMSKELGNEIIVFSPQLPLLQLEAPNVLLDQVTTGIFLLRSQIHEAMIKCLDSFITSGKIFSYKDHSEKYSYWQPSCSIEDSENLRALHTPDNLRLVDLRRNGFINCIFLSFEVNVLNTSLATFPTSIRKYTHSPSFILVPKPWNIYLINWSKRKLKTMDKFKFGIWFRLDLPIYDNLKSINQNTCNHRFQIFPLGVWEWRLLWECRLCGYICHCECFKKAILTNPFTIVDLEHYQHLISMTHNSIPFYANACDVCRGVPSTNEFCHEMYARSIFEQRYGAYIEKRLIERGIDRGKENYERIRREVNNQLRQELGFKNIGERFATETELFRIITHLFPDDEVIHHYRSDWLDGLELDICVPSHRLGIEYHGIQHFEEISAWGGIDALVMRQQRDAKKVSLCEQNNVKLIIFTYDEEIALDYVRIRLITSGIFL